jgi:hypothetical protein
MLNESRQLSMDSRLRGNDELAERAQSYVALKRAGR